MPIRSVFDLARFELDVAWAASEWLATIAAEPLLKRVCPRADGDHPVLTLPGFAGPELSLAPLNRFLQGQGFRAEGWGLGTNRGPRSDAYLSQLTGILGRRIARLNESTGRKVSLVGQSLGGLYARVLARTYPERVDRVITLGSPAYLSPDRPCAMNRAIAAALHLSTGRAPHLHLHEARAARLHEVPGPVPLFALYSVYDGVVAPEATVIPRADLNIGDGIPRENIEVLGSHCGMAVNGAALLAVCDRLTVDLEDWRPFDPHRYLPEQLGHLSRFFYPQREWPAAA